MSDDERDLLHELEPTVERLLERHLATTKEWFPHEHVPYGRGRDAAPGDGVVAPTTPTSAGATLDDAVRSSLIVNLLTEDNLPYYFRTIERDVRRRRPVGHVGPALDGRGGPPLDGHLRLPDGHPGRRPGRARAGPHGAGRRAATSPSRASAADGIVYVALQELATRIAHRNTGRMIGDQAGFDVMKRVAADENLHYLFYRDLASAAIELDPSTMVRRSSARSSASRCPAPASPTSPQHAAAIAKAGIYDLAIHHDQILAPVVCATGASSRSRVSTPRPSRPASGC